MADELTPKKWTPRNYLTPKAEGGNATNTEITQGFISKEDRKNFLLGGGDRCIKGDSKSGLWAGNAVFDDAPFSVDLDGHLKATDTDIILNGLTDPGANTIAGWDDTDNEWKWFTIGTGLTYTHASHTLSVTSSVYADSIAQHYFGDGHHGAGSFSVPGTVTLAANKYYTDLTIGAGVILDTQGYQIFCSGTLTNNGTIANNGVIGDEGGLVNVYDGGTGGAGAGSASSTYGQAPNGGNGGVGGLNTHNDGYPGGTGTSKNPSLGVDGSIAGIGGEGSSGDGGAPGNGGTVTLENLITTLRSFNFPTGTNTNYQSITVTGQGDVSHLLSFSCGSGGGGGGGYSGGATRGGGGGGAGGTGGVIYLAAKTLTNNGTIQANGGDGGDGSSNTFGHGFTGGTGGGGAGGAGGVIVLIYQTLTLGTVQCLGGDYGRRGGNAAGGSTKGDDGTAGLAGTIYKIKVSN